MTFFGLAKKWQRHHQFLCVLGMEPLYTVIR